MIVGICCFLDPKPFGPLHFPLYVIHTILRFFPQLDSLHSQILRKTGQKKTEPNRPSFFFGGFESSPAKANPSNYISTRTLPMGFMTIH
jgi:hypothetical protein